MSDSLYSSRDVTSSSANALRDRLNASLEQGPRRWKAVGLVLAAVVVLGGWAFNRLDPGSTAAESVASLPRAVTASPSTEIGGKSAAPSDDEATASGTQSIVLQVAGAVARPGVYEVDKSARVNDAVARAGGPSADADLDRVNLAAKVTDGQQVFVPRKGEAGPSVGSGASDSATPAGPVNLNTATLADLDALPGVGPSTAQAIIDYREQHGAFKSVQGLNEVKGIGDAKFADLKSKVTV